MIENIKQRVLIKKQIPEPKAQKSDITGTRNENTRANEKLRKMNNRFRARQKACQNPESRSCLNNRPRLTSQLSRV